MAHDAPVAGRDGPRVRRAAGGERRVRSAVADRLRAGRAARARVRRRLPDRGRGGVAPDRGCGARRQLGSAGTVTGTVTAAGVVPSTRTGRQTTARSSPARSAYARAAPRWVTEL